MSGESIAIAEGQALVATFHNSENGPPFARVEVTPRGEKDDADGFVDYDVRSSVGGRPRARGRVVMFPRSEQSAIDLLFRALESLGARLRR